MIRSYDISMTSVIIIEFLYIISTITKGYLKYSEVFSSAIFGNNWRSPVAENRPSSVRCKECREYFSSRLQSRERPRLHWSPTSTGINIWLSVAFTTTVDARLKLVKITNYSSGLGHNASLSKFGDKSDALTIMNGHWLLTSDDSGIWHPLDTWRCWYLAELGAL